MRLRLAVLGLMRRLLVRRIDQRTFNPTLSLRIDRLTVAIETIEEGA